MAEQQPAETGAPTTQKKNRGNLIIFVVIIAAVFAISYRSSVEAVYCETAAAAENPDVIMLATAWCPYCYSARKYFLHNKISYCEYDIEDNGKGTRMYSNINAQSGLTGMPLGIPVLLIGDYQFSGFEEGRIAQALSTLKNHDTTH